MGGWLIDLGVALLSCLAAAGTVIPVGCWWIAKHDARMDR